MVWLTISKASKYNGVLSGTIESLSERLYAIIVFYVLPGSLAITAFVTLINAIVKNRQEIMERDVSIKFTGEHNQMTGLYNRTKYSSMLKESYVKL